MESLNQLLDSCSLPEKMQLVEYAKIKNPPSSKKLTLMKLLVSQPGLTDAEYSHQIYQKAECAAYFQLKKRVKDEFQELLMLLKPSCCKKETQLHIECSELLFKSQLILARGIRSEGAKLLEKGLKMAIKYSLHDLILTIYSTATRFDLGEILNKNDLPELEIAVKSHLRLLMRKNYAQIENQKKAKNQHLKIMISQLRYSQNSWLILDEINQSIQKKAYKTAWCQVTEAESIGISDTAHKTKEELLIAKMSILLAQREFSKLLDACNDTIDTSSFSSENSLRLALTHWYALFHLNKLEDAFYILKNNLLKSETNQPALWSYLEAFIKFKQQKFKAALKQIHTCQKDLKCLPDYYLGSKMLEMMILFDQNDQDWLEYKIENFRKLIARKKGTINTRISHGFQLLIKLQKTHFSPVQIDLAQDPILINLHDEKEGLEWNPDAFELIRYDSWVLSTLKRRPS